MSDNSSVVNLNQKNFEKLADARHHLWQVLDEITDTIEIYPGWQKREFLAHIAGWEAMVFDSIYCHIYKLTPLDHRYTDLDSANDRFVAVRRNITVQDAKLECDINRFAILKLLEEIKDQNEAIRFPWGIEMVAKFIEGAIEHERSHAADIMKLHTPTS